MDRDTREFMFIIATFTFMYTIVYSIGLVELKAIVGALFLACIQRLPCCGDRR